ncbi:hypothetical protein [Streptomyces sp. NPDC002520]
MTDGEQFGEVGDGVLTGDPPLGQAGMPAGGRLRLLAFIPFPQSV